MGSIAGLPLRSASLPGIALARERLEPTAAGQNAEAANPFSPSLLTQPLPEPRAGTPSSGLPSVGPELADGPLRPTARSGQPALEAQLKTAAQALDVARQAGVDLAKSKCLKRLLGAAMLSVSLGVAVAVTVATAGAAAPLLAFVGFRMVVAVADVGCAMKCWRDARAEARGESPTRLPMGDNAVANVLYGVARRCHYSAERAERAATVGAAAVHIGLAVTCLALGAVSPAANLTGQACRVAAAGIATLFAPHELYAVPSAERLQRKLLDASAEALLQARLALAAQVGTEERVEALFSMFIPHEEAEAELDASAAEVLRLIEADREGTVASPAQQALLTVSRQQKADVRQGAKGFAAGLSTYAFVTGLVGLL